MPDSIHKRKDMTKYIKRRKAKKIISSIAIIFLCLYIPIIIILATSSKADLAMIHNGLLKDSYKVEGIFFKEEQLYYAQFDGVFAKGANEGERVPAGYSIASIVQKDYVDLFTQLENLQEEIYLRKQNGEINSGIFTRDLKDIEEQIKVNIISITKNVNDFQLGNISGYLEQIARYHELRNEIISGLSSHDIYVEDLEKQAKLLEDSFANQISTIETVSPGIVTYMIDGLESLFNIDRVSSSTIDSFSQLLSNDYSKTPQLNNIVSGEPFVKMVYGNSFYIGFIVDVEQVYKLIEKEQVKIAINYPYMTVTAKNMIISEQNDKEALVFFEIDSGLNELVSTRKVTCEIIYSEYYGLKVPLSSLSNLEAYPYQNITLGLVKENWVSFIDVDIVVSDQTYAIIESKDKKISLYDFYVQKPNRVEEGQIVR